MPLIRAGPRPRSPGATPSPPGSREPWPRRIPPPSHAHTSDTLLQWPPSPYFYSPRPSPEPETHPSAKPPPQIRGPPGGPIQPSRHYPTPPPRKPPHPAQAGPSRKLLAQGWLSLAGRRPQRSPPLHWPPAHAAWRCTCRAAPRAGPAGDNFLLPAPGVGAVPASPASSPHGIGSAAGRPRPQPKSWLRVIPPVVGAGPLLFPRPPQTRVFRPGSPTTPVTAACRSQYPAAFDRLPACASRNVFGGTAEILPAVSPAVSGRSPSPSQGWGLGNGRQPGPSLTRQPRGPTFSWFPL